MSTSVDSTKVMDVVFTVSGGIYGFFKDKVNDLYTSGALQGKLPQGAIITGVAWDLANDAVKLSFAIASGDPREVAKVAVGAIGGATGTYIGGEVGVALPVPIKWKPITILGLMAIGSAGGDYISEWIFNTYIWPENSSVGSTVSGGGISVGVKVSQTPIATTIPTVTTPADSATRNSASYITDTSANDHLVVIKSGGTVWDAYALQKNSANGISDWGSFKAAVAASNPAIADLNNISAGAMLYLPEKMGNGSITYNFAGGTAINSNATTGEYHMVVPNTNGSGGQTVYSRVVDGDAGYVVKQTTTNAAGQTTYESTGHQATLDADIKQIAAIQKTDTNGDGSPDKTITTTQVSTGVLNIQTDLNGDGQIDSDVLTRSGVSYNLLDMAQRNAAEYQLRNLFDSGALSDSFWNNFTNQSI